MSRSQMPQPTQHKNVEGSSAPSSPSLGAESNDNAPSLDFPAAKIPGKDPNPAGLAENPHVEDPKAVSTELEKDVLKDLEKVSGLEAKEPIERNLPSLEDPSQKLHSVVKMPAAPKGGFEVIATRAGFYNQDRLKDGDRFKIASFEDVGDWMRFEDASLDKKRVDYLEQKKKIAKANARAKKAMEE